MQLIEIIFLSRYVCPILYILFDIYSISSAYVLEFH